MTMIEDEDERPAAARPEGQHPVVALVRKDPE